MSAKFDNEIFAPRVPDRMVSNSSCLLYGWGGASLIPRRLPVDVFRSTLSDDGRDISGFCSTFDMISDPRCEVFLGSPVVCGHPNANFCGIVINKNRECFMNDGKFALEYVHVGDYLDWIKEVSSASTRTMQFSIALMIIVTVFNLF